MAHSVCLIINQTFKVFWLFSNLKFVHLAVINRKFIELVTCGNIVAVPDVNKATGSAILCPLCEV